MTNGYMRIWNERSTAIGGAGAEVVIASLKKAGYDARPCEAAFANHEGIEVPTKDAAAADLFVARNHGRPG